MHKLIEAILSKGFQVKFCPSEFHVGVFITRHRSVGRQFHMNDIVKFGGIEGCLRQVMTDSCLFSEALQDVEPMTLTNYFDSKCTYGYMTLCQECVKHAPSHVDVNEVVHGFPQVQCEMCKCVTK